MNDFPLACEGLETMLLVTEIIKAAFSVTVVKRLLQNVAECSILSHVPTLNQL